MTDIRGRELNIKSSKYSFNYLFQNDNIKLDVSHKPSNSKLDSLLILNISEKIYRKF